MIDRIPTDTAPSMSSLLGGIVSDIQTLIRQEIALAKTELLREWAKAKTAAGAMVVGAGFLALGAALLCLTVVSALHEAAGLPWWASFLIVGGVFAAIGLGLLLLGCSQAARIKLVPPKPLKP